MAKKENFKRIGYNILKYLIAPIITGFVVFLITQKYNDKKIGDLNQSIQSLENTMQLLEKTISIQGDSLISNTKRINTLEVKLKLKNSGVIVGRDVNGGTVTGTQNN